MTGVGHVCHGSGPEPRADLAERVDDLRAVREEPPELPPRAHDDDAVDGRDQCDAAPAHLRREQSLGWLAGTQVRAHARDGGADDRVERARGEEEELHHCVVRAELDLADRGGEQRHGNELRVLEQRAARERQPHRQEVAQDARVQEAAVAAPGTAAVELAIEVHVRNVADQPHEQRHRRAQRAADEAQLRQAEVPVREPDHQEAVERDRQHVEDRGGLHDVLRLVEAREHLEHTARPQPQQRQAAVDPGQGRHAVGDARGQQDGAEVPPEHGERHAGHREQQAREQRVLAQQMVVLGPEGLRAQRVHAGVEALHAHEDGQVQAHLRVGHGRQFVHAQVAHDAELRDGDGEEAVGGHGAGHRQLQQAAQLSTRGDHGGERAGSGVRGRLRIRETTARALVTASSAVSALAPQDVNTMDGGCRRDRAGRVAVKHALPTVSHVDTGTSKCFRSACACEDWINAAFARLPREQQHEFLDDELYAAAKHKRMAARAESKHARDLQQYFTSAELVDLVVRTVLAQLQPKRPSDVVWLEPSCGDGRFLAALLRAGAKHVVGYEIDERLHETALQNVQQAAESVSTEAVGEVQVQVSSGDFLASESSVMADKFVVAVGNPPFGAKGGDGSDLVHRFFRHTATEWRARAIAFIVPERCSRLAFVETTLQHLREGLWELATELPLTDHHFEFGEGDELKRVKQPSVLQVFVRGTHR
ncbi:unnamed protein product [Phytophthora fragariaefolia]|uniref:Unnamed protein product n=1 Tax=Phytophthora fragariaefolia TaxID=1490495 RepID=A0A9W7CT70_9STRA|nr:unnamed protein product [Phytophthora fragariaefolia]